MKRRTMYRTSAIVVVIAGLFCLMSVAAHAAQHSKKKTKTGATAAAHDSAAGLAPTGYRYWAQFQKTPINYDYVVGWCRNNEIVYGLCCSNFDHPTDETILISFPPGGERDKSRFRILFSSKLINDVYDPADPKKPASCVQMARTSMYFDEQAGFVCMNSLFPGQASDYAKQSLAPALFSSPTGEPDTWKYHGKLKGDPAANEKDMKGKRRIGEGCIVRVADGRWRVYLSGYGATLAAAESASLDGPWKFVKDQFGKLRDVAEAVTERDFGGCFPYVLKVSDKEYHLWITEKWPVGPVWHLSSEDGLNFKLYGKQPEIGLAAAGANSMKGIRSFLGPDGKTIYGLIPFSTGGGWVIYQSTMPAGLRPVAP